MGDEFTFQNVRTVVQAIARYLKKKFTDQNISVVVDYDTRFLSERYSLEAAKVLSHNQIHVFLTERDAPSQALAYQVIKRKAHEELILLHLSILLSTTVSSSTQRPVRLPCPKIQIK